MTDHSKYMLRALRLAALGSGHVAPNPMVGAVIVHDGRIIGEGYHRRCGGPHAEVNAIASVSEQDSTLLADSTMYVTLEPCSHFGKTPPCADLIIRTGIPRVVVGTLDPFEKVSGRGVRKLRDAGVEVTVGVEEQACRLLNAAFMTAHTLRRPFITLKWAQSADGFTAVKAGDATAPVKISTPASLAAVYALRAERQAIMIGSNTAVIDRPNLGTHGFGDDNPVKVVVDRRGRCSAAHLAGISGRLLSVSSRRPSLPGRDFEWLQVDENVDPDVVFSQLYSHGITSVLVEGGQTLAAQCLASDLWDELRVEISPVRLGDKGAVPAKLPALAPRSVSRIDGNLVMNYVNDSSPVLAKTAF